MSIMNSMERSSLLFIQLSEFIKEKIADGSYPVGSYLPTVRQLQDSKGISKNTVLSALRVLQEDGYIAREGATRYGYKIVKQPEGYIRSQRNGQYSIVKLILPFSYWNYPGSHLLETIEEQFGQNGIGTLFGNHKNDTKIERVLLEQVFKNQAEKVDALILVPASSYTSSNADLVRRIASIMPLIYVDRRITSIDTHLIGINNRRIGRQAANLLIEKGIDHFGFLTEYWDASSVRDRFSGFRERLEEVDFRIDPDFFLKENNIYANSKNLEDAQKVIEERLRHINTLPKGIFCGSDKSASILVRQCAKRGLSIPDDISIIGCDDDRYIQTQLNVKINSFAYPFQAIAKEVLRLVQEESVSGSPSCRSIELDATPVDGDTI